MLQGSRRTDSLVLVALSALGLGFLPASASAADVSVAATPAPAAIVAGATRAAQDASTVAGPASSHQNFVSAVSAPARIPEVERSAKAKLGAKTPEISRSNRMRSSVKLEQRASSMADGVDVAVNRTTRRVAETGTGARTAAGQATHTVDAATSPLASGAALDGIVPPVVDLARDLIGLLPMAAPLGDPGAGSGTPLRLVLGDVDRTSFPTLSLSADSLPGPATDHPFASLALLPGSLTSEDFLALAASPGAGGAGGSIAAASPVAAVPPSPPAPFALPSLGGSLSASSLLFAGLLGLLATFFLMAPGRGRYIRARAEPWRPLGLVSPLELPG